MTSAPAARVSRRLIDITGLRNIVQRRIPVLTLNSGRAGPVVWLTACVHGDEAGGTAIVHDVFKTLRRDGIARGTLHALPLVNPMGFENLSRYINIDREDLNRCFPGDARGTMGQQIARRLFETIMKTGPALLIDLHNDWIQSVPYVLVERADEGVPAAPREAAIAAAQATGLLVVEDSETFDPTHDTLPGALMAAGIAAFTVEAGGGAGIAEATVAAGTTAILAVLRQRGLLAADRHSPQAAAAAPLLSYSNRPLTTTSGLVRFAVAPGDVVRRGQVLARVHSAFGHCEETMRAEAPGYVLGLTDHARVLPGNEVIALGESRS